jgi:hypothetical protein
LDVNYTLNTYLLIKPLSLDWQKLSFVSIGGHI